MFPFNYNSHKGESPPSVILGKHDQIYFSLQFWLHFAEFYFEGKTE